jgi:hypothetical protein
MIVLRLNVIAFDVLEYLGIPLVTTDRAVRRGFPNRAISPRAFLA